MQLIQVNAAGRELSAPIALDPKRNRLPQVIAAHVDRSRPFMIAVQRASELTKPIGESWVVRGWKVPPVKNEAGAVLKPGRVNAWPRKYLARDCTVVVVYLPHGGGGGGAGGGRSKSPLAIVAGIAGLALMAFAGPIGGLLAPFIASGLGVSIGVAGFIAHAGIAVVAAGAAARASSASRSKANKQNSDTREVYGISGGGNLPRIGETIPRVYGRTWIKPDLSQPDFSKYDGDQQLLYKRVTLSCGKGNVYAIRAGKQVIWTKADGFLPPFNDSRNQMEVIYGTTSKIVPSNAISATGVGGTLARRTENPPLSGPFNINQTGALVSKLEVSFQFPQGISMQTTLKKNVLSNQAAPWAVIFQYAPINTAGAVTGPWQNLYVGDSGREGARYATKPLRYTKTIDVPAGRYAVQGWNIQPDTSENTGMGQRVVDAVQWDAAVGYVADPAVRPGVTELCMVLYGTKGNQSAALGEIEVDFQAVIPVWDGNVWVEQETSKAVWAYCDILRNQSYGAGLLDSAVVGARDLGLFYANSLTKFDTFDGVIRGPVSVYDAAATVLLVMRAEPVYLGRFWSLTRDDTKAVRRHMLTPRQITANSTGEMFDLDTDSGKHHVIGEFDQNGDYRTPNQCVAVFGEASRTPVRQKWSGVKTYDHALHLTRWRAACGAYRTLRKEVGVELEGRIYKRGDGIGVVTWFLDTNKTAQVVDWDGNRLTLDTDITVAANDQVCLRDRTGREWGPVRLASNGGNPRLLVLDATSASDMTAKTGLALADIIGTEEYEMTTVSVGQVSFLTENYLVQTLSMTAPDRATVGVVIDDPRVWDAIGQEIVIPPGTSSGLVDPLLPSVLSFTANKVRGLAGWNCQYAIRASRGCVTFDVDVSYDNGNVWTHEQERNAAAEGTFPLPPLDPSQALLRARAYNAAGVPGVWFFTQINLEKSTLIGDYIEPFTVDIEKFTADIQVDIKSISDMGFGLLAGGEAEADKALNTARDTIRGAIKQLTTYSEILADALATHQTNSYEQRQLIKLGNSANFAAILREEKLRLDGDNASAEVSTALGVRLTAAEGNIVGQATAIQSLSTRVTNHDGLLTSQSQQIATLGSRIDAAELSLSGQATATQQLETRVTLIDGRLTTAATAITVLQSENVDRDSKITGQATAIDALKTRVTTAEGTIVSEASKTIALQSSVADLGSKSTAQATALDSLTTRTSLTETGLASVSTRLTSLSSTVTSQGGDILANSQAVSSLQTRASDVEGKVSTQATAITSLQSTVGTQGTAISASATAISALQTKSSDIDGKLTSQATALTNLQSTVGAQGTSISGAATAISALQTQASSLDGKVTSQATAIMNLQSTVGSQGTAISGSATAISGLQTRATDLEGKVSTQATAITNLQSTVGTQGTAISGSASAISALQTKTTETDSKVAAQASSMQTLSTTVSGHTSTLSTYGTSIDGVKVQFGVVGRIDNTTGGFVLTGIKKLDGTASFTLTIDADVVAKSLTTDEVKTKKLIVSSLQIGDAVVDNDGVVDGGVSNKVSQSSASRTAELDIKVRTARKISIIVSRTGDPSRRFNSATTQPGNLEVRRNGDLIYAAPATTGYIWDPVAQGSYVLLQPTTLTFDDTPGKGTFKYSVTDTNNVNLGGVYIRAEESK